MKQICKTLLVGFILITSGLQVQAAKPVRASKPMSFKEWQKRQILDAQNQVVRYKNRLRIVRKTTGNINEIKRLELSEKVATDNLELVRNFTIEDYFNFYLVKFADKDRALVIAAEKMSKREVAKLLKALLNSRKQGLSTASL